MSALGEQEMPDPSVLVVVPTLGQRPETLGHALHSVKRQHGVRATLVVVVPEAATAARETALDCGAILVDDPQRGLSAAVNAGVAARSDEQYYAWLGDDDLLRPGGLARLCALLDGTAGAVVAYGACDYIDERDRIITVSRVGRLATTLLPWGPDLVPQPASLTRLDALADAGDYDESLSFAMDLDMFLRLRRLGDFVSTREPVAAFRWHADSLTVANRSRSLAESEAVKKRYLPRAVQPFSALWDVPVRAATHVAARRVNARAHRIAAVADDSPAVAAP